MQLVFIPLWCSAPFQIADVSAFIRNDKCSLELSGIFSVYAKISGELHWTSESLWNVNKRSICENSAVQRCKVIVGIRHNRSNILLNKLRVFTNCFGYRTKNYTHFSQFGLICRSYRNRIKNSINSHNTRQELLFF